MTAGKHFKGMLILVFCLGVLSACGDDGKNSEFKGATFAVLSDLHVFDLSLLINDGPAFAAEVAADRKLLPESEAILESAVEAIRREGVQFVLISGDLTKDGELVSFETLIQYLHSLEDEGIAVYVVPGNHDINNPGAVAYDGDAVQPVNNVTPETFAELFHDYGFGEAVARDPDSLSYLAEPVPGLWLLGLDSCKYDYPPGEGRGETSGAFSESTLKWIVEQLSQAERTGKRVIGMMHHGLVEHFTGQSTLPGLGDDYVIDDWESVSRLLAEAGLHVVFTGHYHAQDITRRSWEGTEAWLLDVETGSSVTYPNPYRVVTIQADDVMRIETGFIEAIDWDTGGMSFRTYSENFVERGFSFQINRALTAFGLSQETAAEFTAFGVDVILAHFAGDETPDPEVLAAIETFSRDPDPFIAAMGTLLGALWTDLAPGDNFIEIHFQSGETL